MHEQNSKSVQINKRFHGLSKEGYAKATTQKIVGVGDCFRHTPPPILFKECYSFTRLNLNPDVWNLTKFEPITLIM